jgi:hypothetical protein
MAALTKPHEANREQEVPSRQDHSFHQLTFGSIDIGYAKAKIRELFEQKGIGMVKDDGHSTVVLFNGHEINSLFKRTSDGASLTNLQIGDALRMAITPMNPTVLSDGSILPGAGIMITVSSVSGKRIENERDELAFAIRYMAYFIANHLSSCREMEKEKAAEAEKSGVGNMQSPHGGLRASDDHAASGDNKDGSQWEKSGAKKLAPGVYMTDGKR